MKRQVKAPVQKEMAAASGRAPRRPVRGRREQRKRERRKGWRGEVSYFVVLPHKERDILQVASKLWPPPGRG